MRAAIVDSKHQTSWRAYKWLISFCLRILLLLLISHQTRVARFIRRSLLVLRPQFECDFEKWHKHEDWCRKRCINKRADDNRIDGNRLFITSYAACDSYSGDTQVVAFSTFKLCSEMSCTRPTMVVVVGCRHAKWWFIRAVASMPTIYATMSNWMFDVLLSAPQVKPNWIHVIFGVTSTNDETMDLLPYISYFFSLYFIICGWIRVAVLHSWNRMMQCHMCAVTTCSLSRMVRPIKLSAVCTHKRIRSHQERDAQRSVTFCQVSDRLHHAALPVRTVSFHRFHNFYLCTMLPTTSNSNSFVMAMNTSATSYFDREFHRIQSNIVIRTMVRACGMIEKDGRMRTYLFTNFVFFFLLFFRSDSIIIHHFFFFKLLIKNVWRVYGASASAAVLFSRLRTPSSVVCALPLSQSEIKIEACCVCVSCIVLAYMRATWIYS